MKSEEKIMDMLQSIMSKLEEHDKRFDDQASTLKEHGQILIALRSGQEYVKPDMDGMKIANSKDFASIKEELDIQSRKIELLRDDTWSNKVDIHRMKNLMGMK